MLFRHLLNRLALEHFAVGIFFLLIPSLSKYPTA